MTVTITGRDRLAELMYEVKNKIPDGTFLEFMNILGNKQETDFKDVQFVKLMYFHHEYFDPSDEDSIDSAFDVRRVNRQVLIKILELHDEPLDNSTLAHDIFKSRMPYKRFENIVKGIHKQNDEDTISDDTNMYILRKIEWITPIKYEILKMRD